MTSEQLFILVIVVIVVILIAIILVSQNRHLIKRVILNRLNINPEVKQRKQHEPEQPCTESELNAMNEEESDVALGRLQKLIEGRKKIAWNTDISHHLWGLYKSLVRYSNPHSVDGYKQNGEWYEVKILQVSAQNGLAIFEFELKGAKYKFVDDEETRNWRDTNKFFSLFLYDDSGRCLIEIPMRRKVEGSGSHYSIPTGGPNAFLPGYWINDFIDVKLKHQSIRKQEIQAQKHQERLSEIEELKDKFGILD
jgi:hypothetical protein